MAGRPAAARRHPDHHRAGREEPRRLADHWPVIERFINLPKHQHASTSAPLHTSASPTNDPVTLDTSEGQPHAPRVAEPPAGAHRLRRLGLRRLHAPRRSPARPIPRRSARRTASIRRPSIVLQYTAKDPLVLGIGYAATRDLNSFLRYAKQDDSRNGESRRRSRSTGLSPRASSQSGNFIRSFIHLGFNQDEAGRIVWDGANPHIAARQLALNFRFAVAGRRGGDCTQPGSESRSLVERLR